VPSSNATTRLQMSPVMPGAAHASHGARSVCPVNGTWSPCSTASEGAYPAIAATGQIPARAQRTGDRERERHDAELTQRVHGCARQADEREANAHVARFARVSGNHP